MDAIDLAMTTNDDPGLIAAAVEAFARAHGLDPKATLSLNLILEEIVTNVAHHGAGPAAAAVIVRVVREGDTVRGEIRDTGAAFDPLARAPADVSAGIDEREVGGLGIHLVRTLARSLAYAREGAENILTFTLELER